MTRCADCPGTPCACEVATRERPRMVLPPQPQPDDFPSNEYGYDVSAFNAALQAWERTCMAIIDKVGQL